MNSKKFGGGRPITGTPSLGYSIIVVVFSLLGGASIVHNLYKPNTLPPVESLVLGGIIGLGKVVKRMAGVQLSAPAMVIFHLLFLWGVCIAMIHQAIPSLLDAITNAECALLLFGLYRILFGDPGIVADNYPSSSTIHDFYDIPEPNLYMEKSSTFSRIRYCKICKNSVQGFDHHCPSFGNCIGQKNQRLFMMLLIGFIITKASYTVSSTQYITKSLRTYKVGFENDLPRNIVISTLLFIVLQLIWQVVFLIWNVYCICTNIKTDEWINWKKYPEFHLVIQPQSVNSELRFLNPYDKGILVNIRDFLNPMEYIFELNNGQCSDV